MNVLVAQKNFTVGDLKGNADIIIDTVKRSVEDLVVFSELCVSGYPPLDLLDNKDFIYKQGLTVERVLQETMTIEKYFVIGYLEKNTGKGKPLLNSLAVCYKGKIIYKYHKRLLPTYDIFDEDRYFESGEGCPIFHCNGIRIGFAICEDLWMSNRYKKDPIEELCLYRPDVVISLNASPSIIGKHEERLKLIERQAKNYGLDIVYANQVGGNDDIVFDGNSFFMDKEGRVRYHADSFQEEEMAFAVPHTGRLRVGPGVVRICAEDYLRGVKDNFYDTEAEFFCGQAIRGIRDYVNKNGFQKVVIGESGGIDSAVTTAIAVEALGPERVIAVTMPSKHSSAGSVDDSKELCDQLGIELLTIPIADQYETFMKVFNTEYGYKEIGVTEQNVQARIRGQILMAISNRENALVLSTGNKSELSIGYCVSADSYIFTDRGIFRAEEIHNSEENFLIKSQKVTHSFKSLKNNQVELTTSIGNILKVSEDHRIKIIRNGKIMYVKPKDISEEDRCVISFGEDIWGNNQKLEYFYHKKSYDYRSQEVLFPKTLEKDLAKYLGICVADGSFSGINNSIHRIRTTKDYVSGFCIRYLESVGLNKNSFKVTKKDKNGCFFIETYSVQWHNFLHSIGLKHGAHKKNIPECILKAPKKIVESFISGLLLDSTSNYKKDRSEVLYHSVSKELATQVHLVLLNLGILSYLREKKTLFEVYIPASESEKLLSLDVLKEGVCSRAISNISNHKKIKTSIDKIPINEEELIYIKESTNWKENETIRRHIRQGEKWIGRDILKKYLGCIENRESEIYKDLTDRAGKKELYIPVVRKIVTAKEECMFDFTVTKSHEYAVNGVITHNCTIYGDMCGGINPIADCYKTEVYAMGRYLGIPEAILKKEPSAELAEGQKDTDNLPPYPILDKALRYFIEGEGNLEEVVAELGVVGWTADRLYRMLRNVEYKRRQAAVGVKMHKKAFGFGRRYPIVNKFDMFGLFNE